MGNRHLSGGGITHQYQILFLMPLTRISICIWRQMTIVNMPVKYGRTMSLIQITMAKGPRRLGLEIIKNPTIISVVNCDRPLGLGKKCLKLACRKKYYRLL